jgi:plasmid segregation protein ParM
MKASVFAIDVGYGNTKYAYRTADGTEVTGMFPSLAPPTAFRALSGDSEDMLVARKVVTITIDRVGYEVGPDVPTTAAYGKTGRLLVDFYPITDNYAALLFGAIHFSGVTHIDRLVLGLAGHNPLKHAAALRERFVGELNFGHGSVKIGKVVVIPQPLGSLELVMGYSGRSPQHDDAYFVVDIGYFTTDWLYAEGLKLDDRRSGGMVGGTWQIYQRIADLIARDEGENVNDIERIDKALRDNIPFVCYNKTIDLAPYVKLVTPLISNDVTEIRSRVGRLSDVRSIILTGGGAALYATAVRHAFPRVEIDVVNTPCLANVRGFLVVGETGLAREHSAA